MTTLDLSKIKPIPGFDCVKMKREIQAQIYEETKNMTREEVREYYRQASEESVLRRKARAERRAAEALT
jgi:hypothetical protein